VRHLLPEEPNQGRERLTQDVDAQPGSHGRRKLPQERPTKKFLVHNAAQTAETESEFREIRSVQNTSNDDLIHATTNASNEMRVFTIRVFSVMRESALHQHPLDE
jgi:hypothetical protein